MPDCDAAWLGFFFFSSRRRHTRFDCDWSSDVCSSDLDFLRENGLVHRIESRNAFIACVHNHAAADLVVFLICERCGAVGEASSTEVAATLKSAARGAG